MELRRLIWTRTAEEPERERVIPIEWERIAGIALDLQSSIARIYEFDPGGVAELRGRISDPQQVADLRTQLDAEPTRWLRSSEPLPTGVKRRGHSANYADFRAVLAIAAPEERDLGFKALDIWLHGSAGAILFGRAIDDDYERVQKLVEDSTKPPETSS